MSWLLVVLIKATALLLAVGFVAITLRRASAAARHLVWSAGLVAVLALPLMTVTLPWHLAVLPSVTPATRVQPAQPEKHAPPTAPADDAPTTSPAPAAPLAPAVSGPAKFLGTVVSGTTAWAGVSPWAAVAALWGGVAALLLGRLVIGTLVLRRAVRRSTPLTSRDWARPLVEAADRLGLSRLPRLVLSDRLPMPYACGILRPTIVLPVGAVDWTDRQRRVVLCHELAHVRRFDLLLNAVGHLACALWWFHPLVWVAARRLRSESERACDDLVLGLGTRASEYADHLLAIVGHATRVRTPAVALPMAQRHEFEGRMLAILERGARRNPASRQQSMAVVASALIVVLPLVAVVPAVPKPSPLTDTAVETNKATATDTSVATDTSMAEHTTLTRLTTPAEHAIVARDAASTRNTNQEKAGADGADGAAESDWTTAPQDTTRSTVVMALINTLLKDSVADVRKGAAYSLGQIEAASAVTALSERIARDPSPSVREMAGWALGQIESRDASKALESAALQDASTNVRAIAVWALGQLEDPTSVTPLNAIVAKDSSAEVRYTAAWALGQIGARPASPALIHALQDAAPRVRQTAAWALGQIGDEAAAPALAAALDTNDPDVSKAVFWALGQMNGELAQAALIKALNNSDPAIRARAARALGGDHGDPWPWPWPMPMFGGHSGDWSKPDK
jgi:HEAT repeat protein/beta-lactamase regulating signal transducer with metallopeptidase domain